MNSIVSYESIENNRRKILFTVIISLVIIPLILFGTIHTIKGDFQFGLVDLFLAVLLGVFVVFVHKIKNPAGIYRISVVLLGVLLSYWVITGAVNGYASMWVFVYPLMSFFLLGRKEGGVYTLSLFLLTLVAFFSPINLPEGFVYDPEFVQRHLAIFLIIIIFTYNYEWALEKFKKGILQEHHKLIQANLEADKANNLLEKEMGERRKTEVALKEHRDELENIVEERTRELFGKNEELEQVLQSLQASESALKKSENNLLITLNSIGDGVISTDEYGMITRMNPVAEGITGWHMGDALKQRLASVFPLIDMQTHQEIENPVNSALSNDCPANFSRQALFVNKDKKEYIVSVSCAPIQNEAEPPVGCVVVFKDISEEHFLQEKLRDSQKMEAIGQLAGGVAHDFNNMLGGIIGSAQLMDRKTDDTDSFKKYIKLIIESAMRASDLTGQLLAFSCKGTISFEPMEMVSLLESTLMLLQGSIDKKITISMTNESHRTVIKGDATALQNVFINLGINAAHAMEEGGLLQFKLSNVSLDRSYCDNSPFLIKPGEYIEVEVRDTGVGIPHENIKKIFEPFYTTKSQGKGTGLGLSAVYGILVEHQGAVTVSSEPGKGTAFFIYLPLANHLTEEDVHKNKIIKGSGTILIIDDEEILRSTTCQLINQFGYDTLPAKNGRQGLDIFKEKFAEIDLVLLDMMMPEMNGRDCFTKLKQIKPDIKVVLATGFSDNGDIAKMQEQGLTGYIRKPYLASKLSQVIADVLKA